MYFVVPVHIAIETSVSSADEIRFGAAELARVVIVRLNPELIPSKVMQTSLIFLLPSF